MSTINFNAIQKYLYYQNTNISEVKEQEVQEFKFNSIDNQYRNNNYELDDLLPNWQYTHFLITESANTNSDCSKIADNKVQEYIMKFNHGEFSYEELIEKLKALQKKYPSIISLTIDGFTAEIQTPYSQNYIVDPTEEEINILWKKYHGNQITTIAFTEELEKMNGVSNIELDYSVPSLEQINFIYNGKFFNFIKSRTGFDFDKKKNILHGPSVFQELRAMRFSQAEIDKYFKKLDRVKAADNEYSFKMRDDIHIDGKLITDLMELRDLVVIKGLQED